MKLFVYGTLKQGFPRNNVLADSTYIGKAVMVDRFNLFQSPAIEYPILYRSRDKSSINGELYEVDEEKLALLDRIEGHPDIFRRTSCTIMSGNKVTEALVYFTNYELDNSYTKTLIKVKEFTLSRV